MAAIIFIITALRDGVHLADPARPAVSPVFEGERSARLVSNGSPGFTRCGQKAAVGVNAQAAAQLHPSLSACRECAALAAARVVIRG